MQNSARIIFAGSPDFAVPTLQKILASHHDVVAVLTQPDRPAGRGRRLQAGPVKQAAIAGDLPILQPPSLIDADIQNTLRELKPDLMVVVAYGLLLPAEVLAIPRAGCVNVHASLLPRWRGAAPIQMAIFSGDIETGVSIMQMDAGLDTGPVFAEKNLAIDKHETSGELQERLAVLGGDLLARHLNAVLAGELRPDPQPANGVTYAGRIKKSDGFIDWEDSAVAIDRAIRAYNPWPVAQTLLNGAQLRCWRAVADKPADMLGDQSTRPGTVLGASQAGIGVQTGDGVLTLTHVQAPGRKKTRAAEFANAHPLDGIVLGI